MVVVIFEPCALMPRRRGWGLTRLRREPGTERHIDNAAGSKGSEARRQGVRKGRARSHWLLATPGSAQLKRRRPSGSPWWIHRRHQHESPWSVGHDLPTRRTCRCCEVPSGPPVFPPSAAGFNPKLGYRPPYRVAGADRAASASDPFSSGDAPRGRRIVASTQRSVLLATSRSAAVTMRCSMVGKMKW